LHELFDDFEFCLEIRKAPDRASLNGSANVPI
jgi:hypothetical protein